MNQGKIIQGTFILLVILSIPASTLTTSNTTENPSIQLAIFDLKWYLGYCVTGEYMADFPAHESFRMGLANNGTTKLTLKEINITFFGKTSYCISERVDKVFTENIGLPLTLYPNNYWLYNVTCSAPRTARVDIQIKVNNDIINFGEVVGYGLIEDQYKVWPNWANYTHYWEDTLYTEKQVIPESIIIITGFTTLMSISLVVIIRSLKKIPA